MNSFEQFKADLLSVVGPTPSVSELSRATGYCRDTIRQTLLHVRKAKTIRSTRYPINDAAKALWERFEQ